MTPKEKAEYLMKKFISKCNNWNENYVMKSEITELKDDCFNMQWFTPKDVALEFIKECISEYSFEVPSIRKNYWEDVKNELLKL